MADIPYEVQAFEPRKAPEGKAPYIKHEEQLISDSSTIIRYLKEKFGDPLDAQLTPLQHAIGHMIRRTLEEHTYWVEIFIRWCDDEGWQITKGLFGSLVPGIVRPMVTPVIRHSVKKAAHGQGLARHDKEEIFGRGKRDIDAIAELLKDKPFLVGDEPSSIDATGYGFLVQFTDVPFHNEFHDHVAALKPIVDYIERMRARFWADWSPPE